MKTRIALVGDFDLSVTAHQAIPRALELSARQVRCEADPVWIDTLTLERETSLPGGRFHGIWCVPGSPYRTMAGALSAIRFARGSGTPFLGTCGGFQHAVIEFARNVLHMDGADHAESNPLARIPLVAPLVCPLVEQETEILLEPDSRIAIAYGATRTVEQYHCRYGFNSRYYRDFEGSELAITGRDASGEARAIELLRHPFFIATLYQPERRALRGIPHPVVSAFLRAAAERAGDSGS